MVKLIWILSYAFSAILMVAIVYAFNVVNARVEPPYQAVRTTQEAKEQVKDSGSVKQFLTTGIYVESLNIKAANNVTISGYVWQTLPSGFSESNLGIVFPDAENVSLKLAYDKTYQDKRVLGWYFEGDFIQEFDYSRYPFDFKVVWIRLWPKTLDRSTVLLPDFSSYSNNSAQDTLGVEDSIVMRNYRLLDSYFDYTHKRFGTSFGFNPAYKDQNTSEIRFNMLLKRKTINAFIIHILPLLIVLLIAHLIITNEPLSGSSGDKRRSNFFSMLRIITFILFIVIVAHIELRSRLPGSEIVLLDNFYFIAYFVVVYCVLFSLFCLNENSHCRLIKALKYHDLLYPKALFLPLVLLLVLLVFKGYS